MPSRGHMIGAYVLAVAFAVHMAGAASHRWSAALLWFMASDLACGAVRLIAGGLPRARAKRARAAAAEAAQAAADAAARYEATRLLPVAMWRDALARRN